MASVHQQVVAVMHQLHACFKPEEMKLAEIPKSFRQDCIPADNSSFSYKHISMSRYD